jgi:hypothetical protein
MDAELDHGAQRIDQIAVHSPRILLVTLVEQTGIITACLKSDLMRGRNKQTYRETYRETYRSEQIYRETYRSGLTYRG